MQRPVPTLVLALMTALLAPGAQAGDAEHPEIADGADDVAIDGGANCPGGSCLFGTGNDFHWNNVDAQYVWVNDTSDALVFSLRMKSESAFHPGGEAFGTAPGDAEQFAYTYTFAFAIAGTPYQATVGMDKTGEFTTGGVASASSVADEHTLTVTVPKTAVGSPAAGVLVTGLVLTAHGEGAMGTTLDDRAPDANAGPDYPLAAASTLDDAADDPGEEPSNEMPGLPLIGMAAALGVAVLLRRKW